MHLSGPPRLPLVGAGGAAQAWPVPLGCVRRVRRVGRTYAPCGPYLRALRMHLCPPCVALTSPPNRHAALQAWGDKQPLL
eukprot:145795-Chlamydomonas_euryale.AAC.1